MLKIETFPVYPLECNCTVIADTESGEAIVIDPGGDSDRISKVLEKYKCRLKYIVHTHAHFDHMLGTHDLHHSHGESIVCLHKEDQFLYDNLLMQCQAFGIPLEPGEGQTVPVRHHIEDNESVVLGKHSLEVVHTPGHSPGSVCFRMATPEKQLLFSGDTIFQNSVGRTDLWGGDTQALIKSVKNRIFTLDDSTEVIPGHGPFTSVYSEKKYNPFF